MATQFDPPVYVASVHLGEPSWSGSIFRTREDLVQKFLTSFPITDLKVCPGHKYLEASAIHKTIPDQEDCEVATKWDPIIINIITAVYRNGTHMFREVEIWDGHHRLHAALGKLGKQTPFSKAIKWIKEQAGFQDGDTDTKIFDVLINSRELGGVRRSHWLKWSGAILYPTEISKLEDVDVFYANMNSASRVEDLKGPPLILPPIFLDDIEYFPDPSSAPKVGLFFGNFDPVHNGHLQIMDWVLQNTFIDILVLIPKAESSDKTIRATMSQRCNMLKAAVSSLKPNKTRIHGKIFIFLGNSPLIESLPLRLAFMEGISQVFGTQVQNVWHIEGAEGSKSMLSRYRSIIVPRNNDGPRKLSQLRRIHDIHDDSLVASDFYDQWNLTSSQVRCWLQTYRLPNTHVGNFAVKGLVEACLPFEVTRYIESQNLYLAENRVFHLAPIDLACDISKEELLIHPTKDTTSGKVRGYLLTTGNKERLQVFRQQAPLTGFTTVESKGYQGDQVDTYWWQSRILITINGSFLERASSALMPTPAPSLRSALITAELDRPLSTWEIARYLSHYHLWGCAFRAMHTHTIIFEDRVLLTSGFSKELKAIQSRLGADGYDLCYLYSQKINRKQLSPVNESHLALTAYMLSKDGLETLLENAFPIEGPVERYVKDTLVRLRPEKCFAASLVGRNTRLITTTPKLSCEE